MPDPQAEEDAEYGGKDDDKEWPETGCRAERNEVELVEKGRPGTRSGGAQEKGLDHTAA